MDSFRDAALPNYPKRMDSLNKRCVIAAVTRQLFKFTLENFQIGKYAWVRSGVSYRSARVYHTHCLRMSKKLGHKTKSTVGNFRYRNIFCVILNVGSNGRCDVCLMNVKILRYLISVIVSGIEFEIVFEINSLLFTVNSYAVE